MGSGSSFALFGSEESPLCLENFLTSTESSDSSEEHKEVTYLARDLCLLLSDCFLGFWAGYASLFRAARTSDSNIWMNWSGKGGPANSVCIGSSEGFELG